jgi:hypothetical protein
MGCTGQKVHANVENEMVQQAHYNVLHQLVVMETYVEKHLEDIYAAHDRQRTEAWVQKQHKSNFMVWLKEQDIPHGESDEPETVARLVSGSSTQITMWQGYDINGYKFHTKEEDTEQQSSI